MANNTANLQGAPTVLPFVGVPTWRGTSASFDQRYVNIWFESILNPESQVKKPYLAKRPGLLNLSQPSGGAATGRGLYYWQRNGQVYSVFNNKIYAEGSDLGVTLSGSSGKVWFTETGPSSSIVRLVVNDGTKMYLISTANAVTTVDTGSDAQFPTANLGPVLFFDSYLMLAKSNGEIWNSDADVFTSWTGTSFEDADSYPDDLEAIVRMKDQLIALGKFSTEYYFDNGNPTGSPILRINQNELAIGCATRNSVGQAEDTVIWVSEARDGGRSVWLIEELKKSKNISPGPIQRLLEAEGSDITNCTAFMFRAYGRLVYGLNLNTANRTIMYDVDTEIWFEWASTAGAKFTCIDATEKNGAVLLQDATTGRIYTLSNSTFQDSAANFTVTIITDRFGFGQLGRKFLAMMDVHGDNTTGNLNVSYSDDDYANFSTARTIDMSKEHKFLSGLGSFYRRAFKFTYTDNFSLRLESMGFNFNQG